MYLWRSSIYPYSFKFNFWEWDLVLNVKRQFNFEFIPKDSDFWEISQWIFRFCETFNDFFEFYSYQFLVIFWKLETKINERFILSDTDIYMLSYENIYSKELKQNSVQTNAMRWYTFYPFCVKMIDYKLNLRYLYYVIPYSSNPILVSFSETISQQGIIEF